MSELDERIRDLYRNHINEGFFRLIDFMGLSTVEVEAEGSLVRTGDGREFIDCQGGYGVYNFGHRHPEIVGAVEEQLKTLPMSAKLFLNQQMAELGAKVAEVTPGELSKCFFCNSGTEAVEGAIKLAKLCTRRPDVVYATNAYHGKTLGSLGATDREHYREPFAPVPEYDIVDYGDPEALDEAVGSDTACVLLEPLQGEGGIVVPPEGYLQDARRICDGAGALLVLDEIQTGMGRTGENFACEHEGVAPDLMCLAKAFGGGVCPTGAIVGTPRVWRAFEDDPLIHTSTFGGNQLACAAASAALDVLVEEELADAAAEKGEYLKRELRDIAEDYPDTVVDVRGKGLMIGMELPSDDMGEIFIAQMVAREILVAFTLNSPKVMRYEPPLNISREHLDTVIEATRESIDEVAVIAEEFGPEAKEAK